MLHRKVYGAESSQRLLRALAWSVLACAGCSVIVPAFCQSESILHSRSWKPNNTNKLIYLPLSDIATMKLTLRRNHTNKIFTKRRKNKESDRHTISQSDVGLNEILVSDIYLNELDNEIADGEDADEDFLVGYPNKPYELSMPWKQYQQKNRQVEVRDKRGVAHLYNMISCATGCDPIAYKGYGCYCGFLGSGRVTDGIDRCCKMHDRCYEAVHCPLFTVYFQPYLWRCFGRQPLCALENHVTSQNLVGGCAARLCECDREFAMCLSRFTCPRERALCRSSPLRLLQNLLMFY